MPEGHSASEQLRISIRAGAQTGVDRGALDAAMSTGVTCGGWCPLGRRAEDGRIPERYPVQELPDSGYRQRTLRNVTDSDGTVIIYFDTPSGGTELTLALCIKHKKPYLLIDALELSETRAAERIRAFVIEQRIADLNIAGPRASQQAGAWRYSYETIARLLSHASAPAAPLRTE